MTEIEEVLNCKGRMKILKLLAVEEFLTVHAIKKKINSNYDWTLRHLKALKKEGILSSKTIGNQRLFMYAPTSKRARIVYNFVKAWKDSS